MTRNKRISDAASAITVLMQQGLDFLDQARSSPSIVSFLPIYYAFLQFAKAFVVARRGAEALKDGVRHGLSYNPTGRDSRTPLSANLRETRNA